MEAFTEQFKIANGVKLTLSPYLIDLISARRISDPFDQYIHYSQEICLAEDRQVVTSSKD